MSKRNWLKVLPLPSFFFYLHWELRSKKRVCQELRSQKFVQIKPIIGKDGWFYNRISKHSWYEWKGFAFQADAKQFLFELKCLDVGLLEQRLVDAIKIVISSRKDKCDLRDLIYYHNCNKDLREIKRGARKFWMNYQT